MERRGSPQTLVVMKTHAHYQAACKAWKEHCEVVRKRLTELMTETLKDFLGDMYDLVVSLLSGVLALSPTSHSSRSSAALVSSENDSNRVLPPITKRMVPEVIIIDD
ncbi:hypothetical protein BDZ45DRAFT_811893 [Acephala macrosclerotiorum]|nr:hypothetical protein BDZ45DRAFT_811893 [Acephala macrosclerotiorum]